MVQRSYNSIAHKHAGSCLAVILAAAFVAVWNIPAQAENTPAKSTDVQIASASAAVAMPAGPDGYEELAKRDPLKFMELCRQECSKRIHDYNCTFTKKELVGDDVRPEQEAEVRFRAEPFSVDMTFTKNVGDAARALYVEGKWNDRKGNPLAWVKPAGVIIKTFIPKIKQPINGWRAKKASRRSIDQFGFEVALDLILHYSKRAQEAGDLQLDYVGENSVDGRPTYMFKRLLPYTGEEEPYPDRLLVIHIDKEYLVPTACYSYADEDGEELLGRYTYTKVELNPGYTDKDFDPDHIGF